MSTSSVSVPIQTGKALHVELNSLTSQSLFYSGSQDYALCVVMGSVCLVKGLSLTKVVIGVAVMVAQVSRVETWIDANLMQNNIVTALNESLSLLQI